MANNVNQTVEINYISQRKKIIVGRNNQPVENLIHFDYRITDTFSFSVVNAINQIVNIGGKSYQIFGSLIDSKGELHVIFYTNSYTIQDNVLTFVIDTYTNQYLELIKNNDKEIDLTIVAHKGEGSEVVLRDRALASPRPYIAGRDPLLILYSKVYTGEIPISGEFGAGTDLDLVVGSQSFALGEGLITNDTNQIVFGQYNTPDATKVLIVGGGTSSSNRANIFSIDEAGNVEANSISANVLYISGQAVDPANTEYVDEQIDNLSSVYETQTDATDKYNTLTAAIENIDLSDYAKLSAIPTGNAQLENTANYISGIYVNVGGAYVGVESSLEFSGSDFTWDAGSIVLTDQIARVIDIPTYTGASGISVDSNHVIAITGEVGKTYTGIDGIKVDNSTNKISLTATIPTNTNQLTNGAGFITSAQVDTKITTATNTITGFTEATYSKTDTTYTAGTGLKLDGTEFSLTATIPSAASQLTNDVGFITLSDVPQGTIYGAGTGLKLDNSVFSLTGTVLSGDGSTIAINNNVISYIGSTGSTYSAGYGIGIDSNVISLTATIPTIPTNVSYFTNDAQYVTSGVLTGFTSGFLTGTTIGIYSTLDNEWKSETLSSVDFLSTQFDWYDNKIQLNMNQIITDNSLATTSDVSGVISNKQRVSNKEGQAINYNQPSCKFVDIFTTSGTVVSNGSLVIWPVIYPDLQMNVGEVATFEWWVTPSAAITGVTFNAGINLIGELPEEFTSGYTQVFVVRLVKKNNDTVNQYISYAYEFQG